ncbi:MAG: ABC transporter ATP-binding protein [Chloroflexi bacterium]|nr:MAG: ABC transporter ATP-binding protein [Chloroflexota bacterium]
MVNRSVQLRFSKNGRAIPDINAVQSAAERTGQQDFLRLENVSKSYQEGGRSRAVFRKINLAVTWGEVIAILGKSGSGKTTLLNLVSGIDRVDEGEIYLDLRRLTGLDEQAWTLFRRQYIGFIFQFFNLIPTLSVWENVILPLELNGLTGEKDYRRAENLLQTVGLADRKATFPDRLSGGEQQRVAIARALVHDPYLVLADEPTGNLDEETGRQVLALLDQLTRQAGKSMLLVTHSAEAAAIADRVFALHEGHLVEQTPVSARGIVP